MSQSNVERVIGMLATDEGLRGRFVKNPHAAILEMIERGMDLNPCERRALARMNPHELVRFARALSPGLQKADLQGGAL